MKLSIIVPVYNTAAEGRLAHCLDSLLAQTIEDYEVIAVDDASTDESPQVLAAYAAAHPGKLRVITCKENHRQGGARNRGLDAAQGEWVGFVDSDDYVSPRMYARLIGEGEECGADVVGCDYAVVDRYYEADDMERAEQRLVPNGLPEQAGTLDVEKRRSLILRGGSMVVKAYRREMLIRHGLRFPEDILYEDNCAGPLWAAYYRHYAYVAEPLYYYLMVPDSTTHVVTWERCLDRMEAGRILLEESAKRGLLADYGSEIRYRYAETAYIMTLFSYMYSGKHRRPRHTAQLRRMMLANVPDYDESVYYPRYTTAEERKLLALHRRSNLLFFVYYVLLFGYRGLVKKMRGIHV